MELNLGLRVRRSQVQIFDIRCLAFLKYIEKNLKYILVEKEDLSFLLFSVTLEKPINFDSLEILQKENSQKKFGDILISEHL